MLGPIHFSVVSADDLFVGALMSEERIAQVLAAQKQKVLREAALLYLSYGAHTLTELDKYLQRKVGATSAEAKPVMDRLVEEGYADDRALCERLVQQSLEAGAKESQEALRHRLLRRGLPGDMVREVLSDSHYDEYEGALRSGRKKLAEIERKELRQRASFRVEADPGQGEDHHFRTRWERSGDEETLEWDEDEGAQVGLSAWAIRQKKRVSLSGYLARKGYRQATVTRVLDQLLD